MRITPVKGSSGEIVNFIAIKRDVTKRREAQDAQRLLAAIAESSEDAIIAHTPEGIILTWNRAAEVIFGYSAGDAIGTHVSMVVAPEWRSRLARLTEQVLQEMCIRDRGMARRLAASTPTLRKLSSRPEPIRIGLVGMGAMGRGLLHQCRVTPGLECVAMADLIPERAITCAEMEGLPYKVASTAAEVEDAIRGGFTAICEEGELVASCAQAVVLVEASSAVGLAGRYAAMALQTGKHAVMMLSLIHI